MKIDSIVLNRKIVDWVTNNDIINKMKQDIEDYLYELKDKNGLELSFEIMDEIIDRSIELAKNRTEYNG